MACMHAKPTITIPEIAKRIKKSQSTVDKLISKLKEATEIERVGSTKAGYWKINLQDH